MDIENENIKENKKHKPISLLKKFKSYNNTKLKAENL
jgi:hypothetical protein